MLSREEVARYLGYGGAALEPGAAALADQCEAALVSQCRPRKGARRLPLSELPFLDESADLRSHLQGCREVFLIAVTLGGEADRLLRRWAAENMAKAAVGQACATVWMDDLCEEYGTELMAGLPGGASLLPPYSPGYGDFSLRWQGEMLRLLGAGRLGISLSGGGMLLPLKSVTAVLGIGTAAAEHPRAACEICLKKDCPFRKGTEPCI